MLSPAIIRSTACLLNSGLYLNHQRPSARSTFAPFAESVPYLHCLNLPPQSSTLVHTLSLALGVVIPDATRTLASPLRLCCSTAPAIPSLPLMVKRALPHAK